MLDGIRVLDLSRVMAGPYCTMLMADLGADVVKLERPGQGDDFRSRREPGGVGAVFAALNRNKRSVTVDLQHPEGAKLAFELARRADVIVENFLPGGAAKLGLGYDEVSAANPAVVYASISGFGQSGPYATRPAYNTVAQGISGIMALTGMPGQPPTRLGGTVTDIAAAFVAFGAVNAALVHRLRSGRGQYLDVNLLASTLGLVPDVVAHYFESGVRPGREGNRNGQIAPAEAFRTRDGYVNVVVINQGQWERFCRALGDAELLSDPRFATRDRRLTNRDELAARIERVLLTAASAEWIGRFEAAKIPCGPIYEFDEVFEDPQVRHLGLLTELDQPGYGPMKMLDFPFKASATPASIRRPAPRLGEHTAEVLGELGLEPSEIERLATVGAIGLGSGAAAAAKTSNPGG